MTGILGKFQVEHGVHGTRVLARSQPAHQFLHRRRRRSTAPSRLLKDDLDACAREMKRLNEVNSRGALFEGWATDT